MRVILQENNSLKSLFIQIPAIPILQVLLLVCLLVLLPVFLQLELLLVALVVAVSLEALPAEDLRMMLFESKGWKPVINGRQT